MIDIGQQAPDFNLKTYNNISYKLASFDDKWLVLYFYPKDDTPGCTNEAIDFSEIKNNFSKNNAQIIGISADSGESHHKFIKKYDLKIPLLSDESKSVHKLYDAWGMKKNYGKEYEGVIRSTFIIDPQKIIRYRWRNLQVRSKRAGNVIKHSDNVLKKLIKLQGE
ncbi:MAG: peroxiredoxin [Gammaproteobacteria bacterium]|nr:MAG: peroxiredoxin [Gammaproteobacteria bacterium]